MNDVSLVTHSVVCLLTEDVADWNRISCHPLLYIIVCAQTHLSPEQGLSHSKILDKHTVIFDDIQKFYPLFLIYQDWIPNTIP